MVSPAQQEAPEELRRVDPDVAWEDDEDLDEGEEP